MDDEGLEEWEVGGIENEEWGEKGEWGDTYVVVAASVSSSSAVFGESASVKREERCWWRSVPGGLVHEKPVVVCVCVCMCVVALSWQES